MSKNKDEDIGGEKKGKPKSPSPPSWPR
jgi:hypothetical protein